MESSPSIADPLVRLARLESDFQRALEFEKLEALAEFAAGAGHEINNPLTVISGRAQLLLREETNPERRHALALINAQAMRVYEMIADMMLFARPPRPELASTSSA
jgi:signal transduction histidine kinase